MSRCSGAIHSPGRNPVAAAKSTGGPERGPSRTAFSSSWAQDSNGRFSVRRRCGLSTPSLAGLESIIPHMTARARTCRSAWVASKRCPGEIVIRQAAISCERSSGRRRPPKARSALSAQPAELLDRLRFRVVLGEVLRDELPQRQRAADALLPAEMFERPFECFRRVTLGREASPL